MKNITYVSAGAGSGKTTRIINELVEAINAGVQPSEIIMTTFTRAAAQEMRERAKQKLLENGETKEANEMGAAVIGTIHSVCLSFLQKFWYLVGISPETQEMDENDFKMYVDLSLFEIVEDVEIRQFEQWRKELDLKTSGPNFAKVEYESYWRDWLRVMVDKVRYYHIDDMQQSRDLSKAEIEAIWARHQFNKDEYDRCKQALIDNLPRKKSGELTVAAVTRLKYLNVYDPIEAEGKVEITDLKGIENEFEDWKTAAGKAAFSDRRKTIAIKLVDKLFDILSRWKDAYKAYKLEHKMLDFNDMEVYFYELLKCEAVQKELRRYKLVLVDEFQDCNPIQVDIFNRISDFVGRSIWVGDPKQAIYGFRGTDTTLVKEVSDSVIDGQNGCHRDTIGTNYRSRGALVDSVNNMFQPIFREQPFGLADNEIVLAAGRNDNLGNQPHSVVWKSKNINGIAYQIKQMIEKGEIRVEPQGQQPRLAQYGDVAILVRTNDTISKFAHALRQNGIPFFATDAEDAKNTSAEKALLMALVQYKLSPKYRAHLRMDILHLLKDMPTDELIDDYLGNINIYVTLNDENRRGYSGRDEWKSEDELIMLIEQIASDCYAKGIYETMAAFVDRLRLYDRVAMWGDKEIRQSNVSRMLCLAQAFDHHCEILGIGPSYAEFAKYIDKAQAKSEINVDSQTVKVLTMHKAKGLEWPIVIYYDADNSFTNDENIVSREFFGIREQRGNDCKYWLRVVPTVGCDKDMQPYLLEEPYFSEAKQRIESDEKRLHYVGVTRARDMLITIELDKEEQEYEPACGKQTYQLIDTSKTQRKGNEAKYIVSPSNHKAVNRQIQTQVASVSSINIHEDRMPEDMRQMRMSTIGTCIHNIYAAYDESMDREAAIKMAEGIIGSYTTPSPMNTVLNAEEVITAIEELYTHLQTHYSKPTRIGHEVPFSVMRENGQLLRGEIDLLWHTPDGVVLVDYKNRQEEVANPEHYAGQMAAYREAIESAGLKLKGIVLFYATLGQIITLSL